MYNTCRLLSWLLILINGYLKLRIILVNSNFRNVKRCINKNSRPKRSINKTIFKHLISPTPSIKLLALKLINPIDTVINNILSKFTLMIRQIIFRLTTFDMKWNFWATILELYNQMNIFLVLLNYLKSQWSTNSSIDVFVRSWEEYAYFLFFNLVFGQPFDTMYD